MRLILCISALLFFFLPAENDRKDMLITVLQQQACERIKPMEALDMVKAEYAANFEKIIPDEYVGTEEEYYYKLPFADYYLVFEGESGTKGEYLMHLYEYVLDEPDDGIGHTVTYGWYTVDSLTGNITEQTK